jgi:hypothetical protein
MHEVAGVWHPAVQRVLWGSYVGGDLDGGRGASRMLAQLSRFGIRTFCLGGREETIGNAAGAVMLRFTV